MSILYPVSPSSVGFEDLPLPFSLATQVGSLLFISGQASIDNEGVIVPGTFEEEFHRAMGHLQRILHGSGSDLAHVVQVRAYVRKPSDVPLYNELYRHYFTAPFPARTTLTGCLPESLHFEIECVALVVTSP